MKIFTLHNIKVCLGISAFFLISSLLININLSVQLKENLAQTERLNKVIHQMDKILYSQSFCEANVRGFIITQEDQFVKEYYSNKELLKEEILELFLLDQSKETKEFNSLLEKRMAVMDEKITLIKAGKPASLSELVKNGKELSQAIVDLKNKVETNDLILLGDRKKEINKNLTYARLILIFSAGISILLCLLTLIITKKYIKEKQKMVDELKKLDENKNKFFSLISHDIKSPASQMLHLSKMLKHSYHFNLHKDMETMLELNHNSAVKLKSLVENLLVWGKSQMGKIEFAPDEINLKTIVENASIMVEDLAAAKKIRIIKNVSEEIALYADRNMIDTVIRNILHNAIKYSQENSEIIISAMAMNNIAELSIKDHGIGMKPKTIAKILKQEGVSSLPGTSNEEGSGLGLMLCKEFIERNKGSMEIESEYKKGTTVKVNLPLFCFETLYKSETMYWID